MVWRYVSVFVLGLFLAVSVMGIVLTKIYIYDKLQTKGNCTVSNCIFIESICYDAGCECDRECVKSEFMLTLDYGEETFNIFRTAEPSYCNKTLTNCYFYPIDLPNSIKISRNDNKSNAIAVFIVCSMFVTVFTLALFTVGWWILFEVYEKKIKSGHSNDR